MLAFYKNISIMFEMLFFDVYTRAFEGWINQDELMQVYMNQIRGALGKRETSLGGKCLSGLNNGSSDKGLIHTRG